LGNGEKKHQFQKKRKKTKNVKKSADPRDEKKQEWGKRCPAQAGVRKDRRRPRVGSKKKNSQKKGTRRSPVSEKRGRGKVPGETGLQGEGREPGGKLANGERKQYEVRGKKRRKQRENEMKNARWGRSQGGTQQVLGVQRERPEKPSMGGREEEDVKGKINNKVGGLRGGTHARSGKTQGSQRRRFVESPGGKGVKQGFWRRKT